MNHVQSSLACFLEIGQSSLRVLHGEEGLELPLERLPSGRLTANCRQNISLSLEGFFRRKAWQPRTRVYCALSARGVSLRRLSLPPTTNENLNRVLLLQLENEFPVPPDELAWGFRPIPQSQESQNAASGQQQFLVAAVRREVVEEYSEILTACGVNPCFTLAALDREAICPRSPETYSILDIGRQHSELICFENGLPASVRTLPWGGETITHTIEQRLGISHDEAEKLKIALGQPAAPVADSTNADQLAVEEALGSLANLLQGQKTGDKIYLTGRSARIRVVASGLARKLASKTQCEAIEPEPAAGRSAAILGLRLSTEEGEGAPLLVLRTKPANGSTGSVQRAPWKLVGLAGSLALVLLLLPYAEALALRPYLSKKLAAIKAERGSLALIDGEWGFLQYLKQNQPPYLDALYLVAKSAPPGARIESLSMNRRGDVSLRASMQSSQQVTEFRSKLIDSGFFDHVTLEEQAPVMNQPKLSVRMNAQWKPMNTRQTLAFGPTAEEIEKAKTRPRNQQPGTPPMMGMPMPMMGPSPGPGAEPPRRSRGANPPGTMPQPGAPAPDAAPTVVTPPGALPPGIVMPPNQ